jgi:hypothetical protein
LVARQLGAVAVYESEQKGRRQKAANKQRAAQGKYFGTRRPFGYESDGVTVRDVEAEAIRGAYDLILIGGSLREVGRRWNAAGLHTPQKHQPWNGTIVSRTLRTARLAGIKTYLGDVVRNERGEPIRAEWPAIVTSTPGTRRRRLNDRPQTKVRQPASASCSSPASRSAMSAKAR